MAMQKKGNTEERDRMQGGKNTPSSDRAPSDHRGGNRSDSIPNRGGDLNERNDSRNANRDRLPPDQDREDR